MISTGFITDNQINTFKESRKNQAFWLNKHKNNFETLMQTLDPIRLKMILQQQQQKSNRPSNLTHQMLVKRRRQVIRGHEKDFDF